MEVGLFGFLFLIMLVFLTLLVSFRWCCRRMREYDQMMRSIEEDQERRRQVSEDMWIFTIQHDQNPQVRYGDTANNRPRPEVDPRKPPDEFELPSYEEAIKLPPIPGKDNVTHHV